MTPEEFVRRAQAAQQAVDQLLAPSEPTFVIWSIEHTAWWRAGRMGYTCVLAEAGRYAGAEADAILAKANYVRVNECAIPLEYLTPAKENQ